ncbi:MAG: hypothetical protein KIT31_10845 [Deltaproteobacteria bacterium]|nr:hypothetical protein [Deltaproteobacteria bacterium]
MSLLALSCSGGGAVQRDVQVMSYTPTGSVDRAEAIVIRFDKPIVGDALVGKPADPHTVSVSPPFAWKGFWQDTRTLVVDPTDKLAPSTRYTVALTGELAKRTENFQLAFVHKPLAVEGVWGVEADNLPTDSVPLLFNQPVDPVAAGTHCRLTAGKTAIPLVGTPGAAQPKVKLAPLSPLAQGTAYTLRCEGLTGAGGNAPLDTPYALEVTTRPALAVDLHEPAKGGDVPADEVRITFSFTTPVALDQVRKAVTSVPAIPRLDEGFLSGDGTEYTVVTDLDVKTKYKLSVDKLADTYGQRLAAPFEATFTTGDARPRISMERGIYALEASAKGYPVWTRNVGKFDVECAAIPRDRLVQVLTTDMNYDPWGGNDDDKPIDWKALRIAAKTSAHKTAGRNRWLLDELDLGATCGGTAGARGVYLAEVRSDEIAVDKDHGWLSRRRNRVLANQTDLGILIKAGASSGVLWVTSLSTGAPVAGAKVAVYDPKGKQVHAGATDADGLLRLPGTSVLKAPKAAAGEEDIPEWDTYRSQRMIAVVEKDRDLAVVDGNWANGIQIWNFGVDEDRRGGATKIRGFIQSDRGLYRPGETVHFKGIAREVAMGKVPRVPAGKQVAIEVQDSRGQSVLSTKGKLSAFGGFAFDLRLGAEATLGDYYVTATLGEQTFREKFSVEEFRPATFELKLASTGAANPRPGDALAFELGATYLFGSPASSAKVEWGLRKRSHALHFDGFDEYTFSPDPRAWWSSWRWRYGRDDYGEMVSDGKGTTDANGKLRISARDTAVDLDARGPVDYILSANVTDTADQTMGKSTIVTAHKTSLYLGLFANEFVQAVGMPFGVNLVALTPEGKRTKAKAKLSFIRQVASCAWNSHGHRSYQKCDTTEKVALTRDVEIAAAGSHTERIYPNEPGEYVVKIEGKDGDGNAVAAASQIWVIGKGEAFWSGDEGDRMTLVASKTSYQVGDTARLVAQANLVKPTALVTVERDGVIEASVKRLASASEGVELKIADAWAPNVYASVSLVSGRQGPGDKNRPQFKMGLVELKVASAHKQLDVGVSLDKAKVEPGDKVSGKIRVTHHGAPVAAEVALSVADEGILQLISFETPNPMKTFYASYGLGVDAGTNWNRIARLADPSAGDPDLGGDGGSTNGGQRTRSKFVSSAYWAPMLVTDDKGEIAFTFTAPDNLTAFRLMAVAADVADRFGAGEQRLTIAKQLMAAPALPRFLRSGDAASVGIVIHNNTDRAGSATVTAKATGATLADATQTVSVPANGSARVRFAATAGEVTAASFEFAVAMADLRDAVKVSLPIEKPRVLDRRMLVAKKLGASETWSGSIGLGKDVLAKESTLEISVDRTGVGELAPGLRSLVEYPYGCLEQTMSRFVPLVAAKDLAKTLDEATLQGTKATQFIKAGIAKVIRHQQGDGQFSLWPSSQTYPHLTAYALWGLTLAEKAGEEVPADVFYRGLYAFHQWANQAGNLRPDGQGATIAMGAYVGALRGKADAGTIARLYAVKSGLPRWGQAFLLRAMKLAKSPAAQLAELQQEIEKGIVVADGKALVKESDKADQYHYMNSDVRATAMTIAALLEVDPANKLIDPLVAGLKAQRNAAGSWVSTQENLWSLVALADYGRRAAGGESTATIAIGGKTIATKRVAGAEVATVKLDLGAVSADDVKVSVSGAASVTARVIEARLDAGTPVANGFALDRTYFDAAGKPVTSWKAGDMVTVKLAVTAKELQRWVAMSDPIPAGFEVVNPRLAAGGTDLTDQPDPANARRSLWSGITWDHQEIRDDRVLWFADVMRAGTYELSYQARATIDGTFTVMPASVEAMYQPDLRARTTKATVTITR